MTTSFPSLSIRLVGALIACITTSTLATVPAKALTPMQNPTNSNGIQRIVDAKTTGSQENILRALRAGYTIRNVNIRALHSGKCLDVFSNHTANGSRVQQWSCLAADHKNQLWTFEPAGDGNTYYIKSALSGRCLDIDGAMNDDGRRAQIWDCQGFQKKNQRWEMYLSNGSSNFSLRANHSNKCLDVEGGPDATGDGATVQQWSCIGPEQTNQRWYVVTP